MRSFLTAAFALVFAALSLGCATAFESVLPGVDLNASVGVSPTGGPNVAGGVSIDPIALACSGLALVGWDDNVAFCGADVAEPEA